MGGDFGGGGEKGEEIKMHKLPVIKKTRDIKCSIGNTVSNVVITVWDSGFTRVITL